MDSTRCFVTVLVVILVCGLVGCSAEVERPNKRSPGLPPAKVESVSNGTTVQVEKSEQVIQRPPLWRIIARNADNHRIVFWSSERFAKGARVGVCRSTSPANDLNDGQVVVETACLGT